MRYEYLLNFNWHAIKFHNRHHAIASAMNCGQRSTNIEINYGFCNSFKGGNYKKILFTTLINSVMKFTDILKGVVASTVSKSNN